jgi:general secretion pathway protein G
MKTSHRIKLRAVILFLALAAPILWARFSTKGTGPGHLRTNTDANMILSLCDMYRINNGFYPTTEQGLLAFVREPHTKPIPDKWTALADQVPKDPWGKEYRYECDDPYGNDRKSIRIISAGKDGTFATEDDLILPIKPAPMTFRERLSRWLH